MRCPENSLLFRRAVVVVFRMLGTLLLLQGCTKREVPAPPVSSAVITVAAQARPGPTLTRRGSVVSGARLHLGFSAPGLVASVAVKNGDKVKKGQLLAVLRSGDAAAAFSAAQANHGRALREAETADALKAHGTVSEHQHDEARSMLAVANANVSLAADVLAQRVLTAPIDGTVLLRLAEPGEAIGPGVPVLVLEDTQRLVVRVGITERELARVAVRRPATLAADGDPAPVNAVVSSVAVAPGADGLYEVEVTPPGAPGALRPGSLVTVRFEDPEAKSVVRVPLDALVHREGKAYAFVVTSQGTDARVEQRELALDRVDGKDAILLHGLRDGERIVGEGGEYLVDGQTVRVLQ